MSANKVLFERGTHMASGSEHDEEVEENVWDDSKLNDAYDKALKIANAEVAKRLAMSTNTQSGSREDQKHSKKGKAKQPGPSSSKPGKEWKAGMACRAMYVEDEQLYEAFVLRIINEKECIVRFLGYENCEIVSISSLLPSLGKNERQKQIEQATLEKPDHADPLEWREGGGARAPSPNSTEYSYERRQKSPKKKKSQKTANFCEIPELPFSMPNLSMMANLGSLELPMPPPPPPPPLATAAARADAEDQAVSSMLLSWYMSGYYTGLYQGIKRAKQGRKRE